MQEEIREIVDREIVNNGTTINQNSDFLESILKFLYHSWWRIEMDCLHCIPDNGPTLLVGNTSGYIPWPALMLIYALKNYKKKQRTIYTLIDSSFTGNKELDAYLHDLNFVPWSYDNAKELLEKGEIIAIFPEDNKTMDKTESTQNRIRRFDWTKFLPAVELHVPIHPVATLGVDEANMIFYNSDFLSQVLNIKALPLAPLLPCLPFPFNLATMPVPWKMKIMPSLAYGLATDRQDTQEKAKKVALRAEGDVQAEINRLLRSRNR